MDQDSDQENTDINFWKIKRLSKILSNLKGNGTSMISLVIPPGDQISRVQKMLSDEYGTASNIKSRVNRLSVLSAIISTQQKLKLYQKTPKNGLILYCGTIVDELNKEKKLSFQIEPFKPINTSLYLCDNKFHTDILSSFLEEEEKIGFIIIDGKGVLLGILRGNRKEILFKSTVDLPKKHGRGGQSAVRFGRLRMEKRNNFLKKVAEVSLSYFILDNQKIGVKGIILAGSAEFKKELNVSELLDHRLQNKIIKIVDIAYGGEAGFNQAIELCSPSLSNLKFIKEKKILQIFFEEISRDSGKYVFGLRETLQALHSGAIEKLLVWENLDFLRVVFSNSKTQEDCLFFLKEEDIQEFLEKRNIGNKNIVNVKEKEFLVDWLVENKKIFGLSLIFVSDKTPEGNQFTKGFGGVGAILRYPLQIDLELDHN
mmetsp:Transcript_30523/g.61521  ORF Transcript_30523/g.61521 Transcript_30523/m.61521 type:complete len:428 (+) Transcript_30523:6143-7426(+)